MGAMKDFDRRIRQGGDDAIAAVEEYVAEQERLVAQVESMLQRACDRHWKEWNPVEERLPEVHTTVLAVTRAFPKDIRLAQMASYDGVMWRFCDMDDDDVDSFGVTHWMPLPEPPEVK